MPAIVLAAFLSGLFVRPLIKDERIYQLYARYVLKQPSHKQKSDENGVFDTVAKTNFAEHVTLHSMPDIETRRQKLSSFIWRHAFSPFGRDPDRVTEASKLPFIDIAAVKQVQKLEIHMPLGVTSVATVLVPRKSRSCLMLYQEGHRVSFLERKRLLRRFLEAGCHVIALSLPLTGGDNSRPEINHPRFGHILLNDPDKFEILETESFSTLQYFLTPPIVALNHALKQRSFKHIAMAGFSGGGWVTTMVAALDPRIQYSYSIAGTVPLSVHAAALHWGSYEQRMGRLYEIANYPELYVMAAAGQGRRHTQFYNQDDPCCFAGGNWQYWATALPPLVQKLGGNFETREYILDRHSIGREVAVKVTDDLISILER
ncbi:MAG: hypothetical protein AB7G62_11810 [Magnetospirillum sp.]